MAANKITIVLDTNWYVSATINKNSRRVLYNLLTNEKLVIFFSTEILKEYQQVVSRDKFKKILKVKQVNRFINLVLSKIHFVELKSNIKGSRDINDNFLLSLSYDCATDYLITGDLDLLTLGLTGSTKILKSSNFLEVISVEP